MAVYRIRKDSLYLYEIPLYGSSRLGVVKENKLLKVKTAQNNIAVMSLPIPVNIAQSKNTTKPSVYTMGKKHYETTDWLGNVRVTYTDKKSWSNGKFALNVSSSQDYYPFGSVMEGRNLETINYRFGYGGHEKIDEVQGSGNVADMGDRWLDVRLGRTYTTDILLKETPTQSPYVYAGNNPLLFIDKNGNFKLKYDEQMLKNNGLTKLDIARFEKIVKNISNLIKDNPQALEAISNTTGFTKEEILKHTEFGEGPIIEILDYPGARGGEDGIVFGVEIIKQLAKIDPSNKEELATQTLGVALTILHEYGHYGDQVTNEGKNTGQYVYDKNGFRIPESGDNIILGKQKWKVTGTGHRGTDIEVFGFGVQVSLDYNYKFKIESGKNTIPKNVNIIGASIPDKLPYNLQGTNILKTLEVE
ncbi:MAG: hypothetical protein KatS3mg027_2678 [Bacteroidia bacterium]|nr:MAG: hypothetical protein KatS3mg027_2678 [Bacteroidia bacterium]